MGGLARLAGLFSLRVEINFIKKKYMITNYQSIIPAASHDFKHSPASIRSAPSRFRESGIINLALLNTRSHSADIAGIEKISKAILDKRGKILA